MKITRVTVTPIAFKDAPLLNAAGIHEPYALRSIIEIETDTGHIGLGESYGDAPALAVLDAVKGELIGLDPFKLNRLREIVRGVVASRARMRARRSATPTRRSRWPASTRRRAT
jgi:glucarate dehydratase